MTTKIKQIVRGEIIGQGGIHMEHLIHADTATPSSYIAKYNISKTAADSVYAYVTGSAPNYELHVFGTGKMKDFSECSNTANEYSFTAPWAKYVYANHSTSNSYIKKVHIHDGVKNIGNCFLYGGNMKSSYKSTTLSSLIISPSVREIGTNAFCCNIPASIVIPCGVRRIYNSAFVAAWDNDNKITNCNVIIPDSVKICDSSAFFNTTWWNNLTDEYVLVGDNCLIKYNGSSSILQLPNNVKCIELYNTPASVKSAVTEIHMPNSVETIAISGFNGFDGITGIDLSSSLKRISRSAFRNCTSLENIRLPQSVTSIEAMAFYCNTSLKKIFIPNSVEVISSLLNGVKSSATSPFYGCSPSLKIFCEADAKPEGFDAYFNYISDTNTATVYWGVTEDMYENA